MKDEYKIQLFDLIMALSGAIDLVSHAVDNHHKRVAYIAMRIAEELKLDSELRNNLFIASALHDIGALSFKERIDALQFDIVNPHKHAKMGYLLLDNFEPFQFVAKIVRDHHRSWVNGECSSLIGREIPLESHIIHLADRVDILISKDKNILSQVPGILKKIGKHTGEKFNPSLFLILKKLSRQEFFWLDIVSHPINDVLARYCSLPTLELDLNGLMSLARLFSQLIDYKSRFTSTHSSGVAVTAEALAKLMGFSAKECRLIKIAGYLHDLGKLALPSELLEKKASLTEDEYNQIKSHTYYTYRILDTITDLQHITQWCSHHHEKLDGSGYPFKLKENEIPVCSRIITIADVFTALTEDRPYRSGLNNESALAIIQEMAANSALDKNIVSILKENYDDINALRIKEQSSSIGKYQQIVRDESD